MTVQDPTYLQLFDKTGSWIPRPDYMLLAAMSCRDSVSIKHTYETMLREDEENPPSSNAPLSAFAEMTKAKVLERFVLPRVLAGEVVLELARIAATTRKPPTVNAARRLVAHKHGLHVKNKAVGETLSREVNRAFKDFRNTAHLQAVMVLDHSLFSEIEGNQAATSKFLGIARAFEQFIDANVTSASFQWSPLRVPIQIAPIAIITVDRLTAQELRIANLR